MFHKGFICGWVGMAVIVMLLLWGMTPRSDNLGTEYAAVYTQEC